MNFNCDSPDFPQRKECVSDYKYLSLHSLSTMLESEWLSEVPTKETELQ